jgi:hypothetical protein
MKISRLLPLLAAAFLLAGASPSYSSTVPSAATPAVVQAAHTQAGTKSEQPRLEAQAHKANKNAVLVSTITFTVNDPEFAKDGPSPYVNLDDPAKDIRFMDQANTIALSSRELYLVVDYPVEGEWEFKIVSASPQGFTKADLARQISRVYHAMYAEEARTSGIKVVPLEQRQKLINRNKTNGKFGIWGHDIGDLVLHTVEIFKAPDGKFTAVLGIDS